MPLLLLRLLPYALFFALLLGVYFAGANTVQRKWNAHEAHVSEQTRLIVEDAKRRVEFVNKTTEELNRHIEETSLANREVIESLSNRNSNALVARVQHDRAACNRNTLPDNPKATKGSNGATNTGNRSFLEESGESLIAEAKYADELSNSLKSCRDYITSLQVLNR